MPAERVYIGAYDNTNDFRLYSDDTVITTSAVTQVDANIAGNTVASTNEPADVIRWEQPGYLSGEVRCKLGGLSGLMEGQSSLWLIIYDPLNPNGVVFGPIPVDILQLP